VVGSLPAHKQQKAAFRRLALRLFTGLTHEITSADAFSLLRCEFVRLLKAVPAVLTNPSLVGAPLSA